MKLHLPVGLRVALLTAITSIAVYAKVAYTGTLISWDDLFSDAATASDNAAGLPANSVEFNFIEEPRSSLEDAQHPLSIASSAETQEHTADGGNTYTGAPSDTSVNSQIPAAAVSGQLTSSATPRSYSVPASAPLLGSTGSAPGIAPVASAPANANVPSGYTEVTITSPDQLGAYSSSDYIAFVIGADITNSAYRMTGDNQYWTDSSPKAHTLTFSNLQYGYGSAITGIDINIIGIGHVVFADNLLHGEYAGGSAISYVQYSTYLNSVNIINNGEVVFRNNRNIGTQTWQGNVVSPAIAMSLAGGKNHRIEIKGNESVILRGNDVSIVVMASKWGGDVSGGTVLDMSSGADQRIEIYDMMYIDGDVTFNSEYRDASGLVRRGEGDIIISGKYLDEDYKWDTAKILFHDAGGITVEKHTTQVNGIGWLYAGCLHIEDGAVYQGRDFVVGMGDNAALALRNGTMKLDAGISVSNGCTLNLQGGGNITADIDMAGGSTLKLEGVKNMATGNLNMADGSTLDVTLDSANIATSLLSLSGNWVQEGLLYIDVAYDEEAAADSPLRIIDMWFKDEIPASWSAEDISVRGTTFDKLQWSEGILYLNLTGEDIPLLPTLDWKGGDMKWNGTSANWENAGVPALFASGNKVRFGDNGSGVVLLEGSFALRNVLVENSEGHDYTFSGQGKLFGVMQLVKDGAGMLTINTANDYTGGTVLNNGTLVARSSEAFGSGAIRINGGKLDLGGNSIANAITFAEGVNVAIRNGALNTDFTVLGGNVDADGVHISTQHLNVERADCVTFSWNDVYYSGGAIYGGSHSAISLTNNDSVTFSWNDASCGGAIYGSTVTLSNNRSVTFSGNYAASGEASSCGGAIYGASASSINLTNNRSVTFSGNYATSHYFTSSDYYSCGGAIYGGSTSSISLTGNGSVVFSGNSSSSYGSSYCYGGAIYSSGMLNVSDNESVEFRGNYEQMGSGSSASYRLRSVYMTGGTLKLAAGEDQKITFYDTLYAGFGTKVSFNADYTDKEGVTQKATGDIVFSGKYAKDDLAALKSGYTKQELTDSLTTEVRATTNLYGGRLRIEDGAIYKGYGINMASNSGATLRLNNGTLEQAGYNVTLQTGTTLDLQGVNNIAAQTLDMQNGSILSITLGTCNFSDAALTLDGTFNQGGDLIINIQGDETYNPEDRYRLISMTSGLNPESWETTMITLIGVDSKVNHLEWENGVLYFKAVPPLVAATWSGEQSMVWNTTVKNWVQDDIAYAYKDGVDVEFSNTGSGSVILEGNLAPASVLVNNGINHDYTFTGDGKLTGDMQLTKEGDGTLTIGTANDYTGGTVINGGVVVVDNATALGSGDVALNGTELDIATDATISGQITIEGENLLVVADGHTLTLDKRIVNNAFVDMQGTFDISGLSSEILGTDYTGGAVKGNGFVREQRLVQVVENAYGAYAEMAGGTFLYDRFAGEAGYDGDVTVYTVIGSAFYVNKGTESLSKAYEQYEPTRFMMADGTTLNLNVADAQIDELGVIESGRVILNVTEDTKMASLTGGGGESNVCINATGKTVTMGDSAGYTGNFTLNGGTLVAESNRAFAFESIQINDGTLDMGGYSFACDVSAENAAVAIRNGRLGAMVNITGGSLDADELSIRTQNLIVKDASEVSFCDASSNSNGGAIYAQDSSTVDISNNQSVTFAGNRASTYPYYSDGGAIHGGYHSNINLSNNGSVTFRENQAIAATSDSYSYGGAVFSDMSSLNISGNDAVTFSKNSADYGGALCGPINLTDNGNVTFSENSAAIGGGAVMRSLYLNGNECVVFNENTAEAANSSGGAIRAYDSIVSVTGNGSVTFSGNSAEYGGAIYSSYVSAVDMADNDSIAFIGNSGTYGAAIYGAESSSISLVGNKNVEFRGNVSSDSYAGAIYIEDGGSLNLIGNDHVEFRGNYLKYAGGEEYVVLQGIYVNNPYGSYYNCNLNLAAGENQDIVFYDPLYVAEGTNVSFNASFEDKDGVMQAATGDIVFSGVHAEEDVREIFDKGTEYLPWHSPTYIPRHSQTSAVYTTTHLYGGRLCIEDGAIYTGKGINVAAGSAATLRLADGTLEQARHNVTLNAGTTLDLAGVNSITAAALYMLDGSTLSFTLGAPDSGTAVLSMNGSFVQEGALTISLAADGSLNKGDEFLLMTLSDIPASWDESNITVNGLDAGLDNLSWVNGNLYFMYGDVAPLQTATWSGAQSRTWNITERNWTQGEYSYRYKDGVDVVFGDTGSGEVELEGELAPQSVLVENSAGHDYAFTGEGKLTGGMQLTKDGEGKLTISNSNTYTSGTVINGGTLRIENGAALGTNTVNLNGGTLEVAANGLTNAISAAGTSAITVENGNTLALQSAIENLGTLTLKGAFDASALTLTQEAPTHVDVDGNVGDSGFTRTGAGSVIVVNGGITVDGGATISHSDLTSGEILVLEADGRATANGVVDYRSYLLTGEDTASVAAIKGKAGDQLQAINVEGGTLTIDTATDVLNATGGTVNITENVAVDGSAEDTAITAAAGALNAVLSGTTSITVTGDVTINGANTHSGITTVQDGTLHVGHGAALGTGTVSLSDATLEIAANGFANDISSTGTNGITIADGYTLALQNAIENVGTLTLQGAFDASALDLVHGKATRVNTEGVSGNSGFAKEGDYSVTIVNGGVSIDGGATITHNEVASLTFVLATNGTATSEGAVDYSSYLLTGEDTASVAAINEKAGENLESIDVVGGVLTVDAATDVLNAVGGAVNITENVAVDGVLQDTAIVATAGTINASMSGATSLTVAGEVTVNGENSHNGGTTIQGGTLHLGSESALGEGLVTLNGGTLDTAGMSIDNHVVVTGDSSIGSGALEGSLTINGAVLHALGNIDIEGQLATEGQSGIVAKDGSLVTLFQTIHNTGELALSGEFDLSLLDCQDQGIHYMIGPTEGNGFATEVHSITVVDAGTCDLDAGTFRYRGETAAFAKEGVAYLTDTNYSRFYVFSGTESLSTALDTAAAGGETMEGITMSDGARLRVDRDMDADFVTVTSGTATLDIAAGATVSEGDGNRAEFNLTGSGIYSLADGNMELGATLDSEGWRGTVALNHVADEAIRTMNLNDYGHEGSIVRLNGVQGHFIAGNTVFNPTLELVGDGLEIVSCQSGRIYEFAGGVKGDGNLTYNLTSGYAHNQTYVFSGDVSEWTGAYESLVDKKTSTLKFIGDATEMGAAIRQTAGTVNVEVGNGTDEHTTAFKNEMEAGTFTVKEHATAVLENTATITNSLSLQGTLEIKGGSVALAQNAEVVVGDAYTITGKGADVTALSGTLSMDEQGLYGTGDKAARIDHSIIKLAENSRVEVSNVILGASSKLLDDPATVVANGMVIEAEMGVNVEAGDALTLAKGSVMTRLGNASESVTLNKDSFACTFDITNVQDVRLTGDCLTIDISSMYPELKVLSAQYEWLGISLGDGDHAATVDENLMVEFILSDRLRARGYYLSSVGWGGTAVTIPEPGENVGMIYIPLYEVPEPATSTLSLLALAALAYRRRKK